LGVNVGAGVYVGGTGVLVAVGSGVAVAIGVGNEVGISVGSGVAVSEAATAGADVAVGTTVGSGAVQANAVEVSIKPTVVSSNDTAKIYRVVIANPLLRRRRSGAMY
jgi:hypothetical protein